MLIDTHGHINMMVKEPFDRLLTNDELAAADAIMQESIQHGVTTIINVGTSVVESENCMALAKTYPSMFATIGIHPNDCTAAWRIDVTTLQKYAHRAHDHNIVGIGEIGLDRHYKDYNLPRQKDAFRAQIELALEYDLAIVIHSREARDETLHLLSEYKGSISRGIIHCFCEDLDFAIEAIAMGFSIGLGGTITYPKNTILRTVATSIPLERIVLETDAPFLAPQTLRGQPNHPKNIRIIAEYLAQLRGKSLEAIATQTTANAAHIFKLKQ